MVECFFYGVKKGCRIYTVKKENLRENSLRLYLITLGATAALISCILVYVYINLTASLILAQVIAVPLAIAFVLDSKIRLNRAKLGTRPTWWTGIVVEGKRVRVSVDWNSCMGASSCVELAPKVFRLDWSKKKSVFDPAPLELLDEKARGTDPNVVFSAAQSCPYHAIILEDDDSGERIFP
jgi:ferredoxin